MSLQLDGRLQRCCHQPFQKGELVVQLHSPPAGSSARTRFFHRRPMNRSPTNAAARVKAGVPYQQGRGRPRPRSSQLAAEPSGTWPSLPHPQKAPPRRSTNRPWVTRAAGDTAPHTNLLPKLLARGSAPEGRNVYSGRLPHHRPSPSGARCCAVLRPPQSCCGYNSKHRAPLGLGTELRADVGYKHCAPPGLGTDRRAWSRIRVRCKGDSRTPRSCGETVSAQNSLAFWSAAVPCRFCFFALLLPTISISTWGFLAGCERVGRSPYGGAP